MATARQIALLNSLLDALEPTIRAAFIASITDLKTTAEIGKIITELKLGNIEAALGYFHLDRPAFARYEDAIRATFIAGGELGVATFPVKSVSFRFDVRNLRAERFLQEFSSSRVVQIIDDQRNMIRDFLTTGMSEGRNPRNMALDVVGRVNAQGRRSGGVIGLTHNQAGYVVNARNELISGDYAAYLRRDRRDKRWDKMVRRHMANAEALPPDTIARITGRYSDRLLQLRGETIARTEALTSLHAGKHESFRQGLAETNYRPEDVTKVWHATLDNRVRETHAEVDGEAVLGMETPFQVGGSLMMHPGDMSLGAGPEEIINCRCDTDYEIDFSVGVT